MTTDTVVVDRYYLWALEVLACNALDDSQGRPADETEKARRRAASLRQPRVREVDDDGT